MLKKFSNNYLYFVIAIHLAIALPLAYFLNVWSDEASTLSTTDFGIQHAFSEAFSIEKQAPLYFVLLSIWRNISNTVFFARIFSIIFSVAAIAVFPSVAKIWFTEQQTKYFTAFFALHPFLFCMTLEIRAYSAMIMLSLFLLKFFHQGFLSDDDPQSKRRSQMYYAVVSVISIYTHYYLGFNLVAHFCVLLALKRWKDAKVYFYYMLAVGITIVPLLAAISQQFASRDSGYSTERSAVVFFRSVWTYFLTFAFPTEIYPTLEPTLISIIRNWIFRIAIVMLAIYAFATRFRKFDKRFVIFATINAVICGFMALSYYALGEIYIAIRHFTPIFISVIFLQFLFLTVIIPQTSKRIWLVVTLILAFLFPYSMYKLYPNAAKRGDWARVAEYVEKNETADQPIIVFQAYDAPSLRVHYKGSNKVLPEGKNVDFWIEGKKDTEESMRNQINFTISKIPPEAGNIWLLTDENCQTTEACKPLEEFVAKNYNVIDTKDFYLERVRLLKKK